jgi:hypothetical protein
MSAEAISAALDLQPRIRWNAGDPRLQSDGTETADRNDSTYWSYRIESEPSLSLMDAIENSLLTLEESKDFLLEFVRTGGEIEYFIGWFTTETSGGETLSWELLKRLGELNICLSLDVYGNGP